MEKFPGLELLVRQRFSINFNAGSPESPAGAHISHTSRTLLMIRDVDVQNSGLENQAFIESHIIQAVRDLEGIKKKKS